MKNNFWINISDLMSILMIIFLFISISFMYDLQQQQSTLKKITTKYQKYQKKLNMDLHKEFNTNLPIWGAQILKDNTIRFNAPNILFKSQSDEVSTTFQQILDDFFPRYIRILTLDKYKNEIEEIRIEGHTSSLWQNAKSSDERYLKNMDLSQQRATNVLKYCYLNKNISKYKKWLENKFLSIGMSYSKIIKKKDGSQDYKLSRRVDFRVIVKSYTQIYNIRTND
jgi:outer membrane protein OmpA-like peptidoglycan-associated protein